VVVVFFFFSIRDIRKSHGFLQTFSKCALTGALSTQPHLKHPQPVIS